MSGPFSVKSPVTGLGVYSVDGSGNSIQDGYMLTGSGLILKQSAAPNPALGSVALYSPDGATIKIVGNDGVPVGQEVTGNLTVDGTANVTGELVSHTQLTLLNAGQPSTPASGAKLWSLNNEVMVLGADGTAVPLMSEPYLSAPAGGAIAESVPRFAMNSAAVAIGAVTGTVYMAAIWLPIGAVVSNVTFLTGSTAANTPTHWWAGVSTFDGIQRAHSADQLTAAIAANTLITVPMVTPYTAPATGTYYFLLSVTATANPTLTGVGAVTNSSKVVPVLAGTSASAAQSTPGTDGTTTYTRPTGDNAIGYFSVS